MKKQVMRLRFLERVKKDPLPSVPSFPSEDIIELPINSVIPGKFNPRENFDPSYIRELSNSIKRDGQWDSVLVKRRPKGKYDLLAGECRWKAATKLRKRTIKARVLEIDETEAYLLGLKTNLMRRELTPVEEGCGIKNLKKRGLTQKEIAKKLGKSETWVSLRLKLEEKASEEVKNAVSKYGLPLNHAVHIAELLDGLQGPALEKILKEKLDAEETIIFINLLKNAKTPRELEAVFKKSKEDLIKFSKWVPAFGESGNRVHSEPTTFKCECGTEYIADWDKRCIISKKVGSVD